MTIFDIPWLSESIKKRALRYLLQRYLGHFLLEKLTLDQLSLDLYQGKGSVRHMQLDVDTINEELNHLSSFRFIEGSINELSVFIPWTSLLTDASTIHFDGISLNLCKFANNKCNDLRESTLISTALMTSSMQIAEEIVNTEDNDNDNHMEDKFDGLEMFAQLIDSVLRRFKLSATNTSFKFVFPRKTGDGQQIEVRVKHMKCEEEQPLGDCQQNERNVNIIPETITKIITLEGIEILVNSVSVCRLTGRHSVQLKIDENKTDLQVFFGSHILAIINSRQLETLIELFESGEQLQTQLSPMSGEKLMSSEDYIRVEQQLQLESGCAKSAANAVISSQLVKADTWSGLNDLEEERQFFELNKVHDKDIKITKDNKCKRCEFLCHLRIPGLTVCLLSGDNLPQFEGMPIIDTQNSFSRINSFIDKVLDDFDHLRFLSLQLSLDINTDSVSFTCGDLMISEVLNNKMTQFVWNKNNNQMIVSPFLRFNLKDNNMSINLDSINLRIDLTFMERYKNYFNYNLHKNNSQTVSDFNLNINCKDINAELMFPIPDLRPHEERSFSINRNESLLLRLCESTVNIKPNCGELKCQSFAIDFKVDDNYLNIINGHSMEQQMVSLKFRLGLTSTTLDTTLTEDDINNFYEADMEDSIYVGQTVPQPVTEPFQVKRKVIGRDNNDNDQVLTPGDRDHMETYMATASASSQMHLDLVVPSVDIHFQNKDQFELIYNRIGNDLILWTPFVPLTSDLIVTKEHMNSPNPTFFSIKTMSDSSSTNSSFHSFIGPNTSNRINFMTFCVKLNDVTFEIDSKQETNEEIFCQNLLLGLVVGDKSESNSNLCLCADNVSFKSQDMTVICGNIYNEAKCLFSLALDIKRESDLLKKIKLAIQLSNAAMFELQVPVFEQFWEFINVTDEVVIGYTPPKVITELHINLLDSAIALENLTTRTALILFEDIYMTSMVVENTNETLLQVMAEETLFCLKRNKSAAEVLKNYICIIQTGIIDINLKLSRDGKLEFKVSNNAIDVRVCADSFTALCQIISSLTENTSSNASVDSNISDNNMTPFEKTFDDKLMEDAMGDSEDMITKDEDSDDEPPKFCTNCESPPMDMSDFWVLGADDLGTGIKMTAEPQIRVLTEQPINVIENHFNISHQRLIPEITPSTICRYLLEEMTLILHLFDGKDFDDDTQNDSPFVDKKNEDNKSYKSYKSNKTYYSNEPRVRFSEGSVHMWENIDLVSAPHSLRGQSQTRASNSFKCMGGLKRQTDTCVLICLNKVKTLFETFDPEFQLSWRFLFMVQDIEVIDKVVASKIKKMLYEYYSESMPRRKHMNMFSIKATTFRNKEVDNKEECELKISIKPLRINIDQDTLIFICNFFSTVVASMGSEETQSAFNTMVVANTGDESMPSLSDTSSTISQKTVTSTTSSTGTSKTQLSVGDDPNKVFFRLLSFAPDVPISLDYHGKHLDFERGALQGLFLGLAQLNQSELRLKRLHNKHGLLGFDKVMAYLLNEWTKDIKRNQLPSLLGGVGPMHSFIQLFQGIRDLFWMPIDQYRRDRRLVRGIQRGAHSFSSSTAMATLDLANRVVTLIQSAAQFAHDVVTPPTPGHRQLAIIALNAQPRDLREGISVGYAYVREGLHDAVRDMVTASKGAEDIPSAVGGVMRNIPSSLVRPIIGVTQGASNVLMGMRNQLTPEARKDDHDKWKNASER
ncbi:autophagy-related protein 2 homolog A-like [Oppia nitens]|uniref:autophagy-related protein 2 homolog A-like n=1 Tax=Oppia nitens TaxID=1686743 RepID=UPI0023DB72F8|nr:autophagy-related protein 2 homolog A-like [Oppia nitens]